ncbi:NAD(P)-binding protein [Lophiostoma macrostomum CBS 122681]|uniref:NAD(P)-binding protein n=1 Tax=Lophiostoma macrostomum CBS 122681 TaxID=1314788 RepID=A0A6A6SN23_9PLEO|nr:NAD(P)-binding protein [Lophiostoma macrostomum CBS 122681]
MAVIAVAGGTGGVGKAFVQELAKTKHQVIILSRTERESKYPNVTYAKADYANIPSLTNLLETFKIDTVISAIVMESVQSSTSQLNLIAAAEKSSTTKRFIPSEFGGKVDEEIAKTDPWAIYWLNNTEALSKTSLQWTRFAVGFFMDYWGMPHIDSTLNPFKWAIDVENGVAAIPGTGEEKLTMTYTRDFAKFVVRLLDEAEWPQRAVVSGQVVTFNQVLGWAQEATGRKFKVTYDSIEKLERGEVTPLYEGMQGTPMEKISEVFGKMTVHGQILVGDEEGQNLNERFPELRVTTVEEMIRKNWKR